MSRYSAAWKTAGAGTANALPIGGLVATTAVRPRLKEVGVWNTTSTAVEIALRRLVTAVQTPGATQTAVYNNDNSQSAVATAKDTWTGTTPTYVAGNIRYVELAATVGAGVIWVFGGDGLIIPNTANDAIVLVPTGTGQICIVNLEWEE